MMSLHGVRYAKMCKPLQSARCRDRSSGSTRRRVNLSSIDRSNQLISRCRYALDMDSNGNVIFRVHYSACNVQTQDWFLLFRGEIEVSVGDASLIGVEIEMNKSYVTVKGLRDLLLSPREFLDRQAEVLPLWIGHGVYVYSLEASCPLVTPGPGAEVAFHIPKQRMGLVKRGSYSTETVTLKNIVVLPPINVTVTENKHFVMVNTQAADLLRSQDCITRDNRQGIQDFYSLDLVLEFAEIAHPMNWTLENYYECTGENAANKEMGGGVATFLGFAN
ncbi:unnamed protein product [Ranitomeya imitator]|uniref:CIROZ beta domain-containing protein n=1 Tax=Ranitomeya imitator TaxID=111125 RepID=A0ABN9LDF7_9NEOB|nr:unnamed protein product [Ranitomeya imitator]